MLKKCKVCGKESYMNFWEDTCCACSHRQYLDEIKQDILSDEKTGTSCEDEVIYPWCGEVQKYDADIPEIYQDGYHEMQCHDCERLQGYPDYWTELPQLDSMTAEQYEFFKATYLLDKTIKGQTIKKIPNREQLIKWYNKLDSDGTRYKQLGNSLAIPCALRVIGGIAEYVAKENPK